MFVHPSRYNSLVTCLDAIVSRIRERGPITAAELMQLALYDPEHGYYATAGRRSGRRGDFYTSVDVGPLFGEMIAVQLAEMGRPAGAIAQPQKRPARSLRSGHAEVMDWG